MVFFGVCDFVFCLYVGTDFIRGSAPGVLCLLGSYTVKKVHEFPVSSRDVIMSLTKLSLGRNNSVMTSLFPPRESLVVTSRLGTGNSRTFFLRCSPHRGTKITDKDVKQRSSANVNSPYKRKCWTNSMGPLVNSLLWADCSVAHSPVLLVLVTFWDALASAFLYVIKSG